MLFAPGRASEVDVGDFRDDDDKDGERDEDKFTGGDRKGGDDEEEGIGGDRDRAGTEDGLGDEDAAAGLALSWGAFTACLALGGVLLPAGLLL